MISSNILDAMGNTPLVRLNKIGGGKDAAQILVKYEAVNVGGSVKTRTAFNMLRAAEKKGLIKDDTIIVEPTSGNQGIGLALAGAVKGYKTVIVMPDSVSEERRKLVKLYGADVILVHDAGNIGKCIEECMNTTMEMMKKDERVYVPQQFANEANVAAHYEGTGREIVEQAGDVVIDGFCSGIGTGGTITGIGRALLEKNPDTEIWAAEPENAALFSGGKVGTHMQMGIGDGVVPDILDQQIFSRTFIVKDADAIKMSQRLAAEEGLMCGISSGTNVVTAIDLAKKLGPGKTVVTLLPDTAERYFSTPLFDFD